MLGRVSFLLLCYMLLCYIWIIFQTLHITSKFRRKSSKVFPSSYLRPIDILLFYRHFFVLDLYSLLISDSVQCVPNCPQSHYVAKDYLQLILLPPAPKCWVTTRIISVPRLCRTGNQTRALHLLGENLPADPKPHPLFTFSNHIKLFKGYH